MTSRALKVIISGDSSKAQAALRKLSTDADRTSGKFTDLGQKIGASMQSAGRTMTFGVTLPLIAMGTAAVASLGRIERLGAQTDAVIESTGGAANVTREHVVGLADDLERMTSVESEVIQEGQNMLLTFTNIANKAGEGNDIFDQATEALVNMVAAGRESGASAIQLGKALNDPIKGVAALSRVGIQFTDEQKELIKSLVASGDIMGAQKVILGELETQFGGVGEALGGTMQGRLANVGHQFSQMTETLAVALIPVIETVTGWLTAMLDAFHSLTPGQQKMIAQIVAVVAAMGPLIFIGGKAVSMFTDVDSAFNKLNRTLKANPWVLLTLATIALVVLIVKNWDTIKATILAAWDAIKSWTTGAWETIKGLFSSALSTIAGWVSGWALTGFFMATWAAIRNGVDGVKAFIEDKWNTIVGFFKAIPGTISAALSGLWAIITAPFAGPIQWVMDRIQDLKDTWAALVSAIGVGGTDIDPLRYYPPAASVGGGVSQFAKGGPFSKGDVAVVGEEGPEVAVFGADGYMIPNHKLQVGPGSSWGGGSAQNIYVTVTGDVYGLRDLESVVVGAITTAQQRGRIAAPVGADTPPARPARPPA